MNNFEDDCKSDYVIFEETKGVVYPFLCLTCATWSLNDSPLVWKKKSGSDGGSPIA